MKLIFASDIHGSAYYALKLCDIFKAEGAQRLVLLGDILYHGPRNDLPRDYSPKKVFAALNEIKDSILCVRGNCDSEVDQMVLEFPCMADYIELFVDGITIFATHGHLFNEDTLPPLRKGDVLIHGHTHVRVAEKREGYTLLNPSSISLPKDGINSYIVYENGVFTHKDINGNELSTLCLK